MNGTHKVTLIILGVLSALLLASQLTIGLHILSRPPDAAKWIKIHQHSGYTTVAVSAVYLLASLATIARIPARPKG